jgi:large subunit ribosomal protein L5
MNTVQIQSEVPMKAIRVEKVVLNIGVGKAGEPHEKARKVLQELTGQKPAARAARESIRDFGVHEGEPIGVIVTLRKAKAIEVLKRILAARDNKVNTRSFDNNGNFSFGVKEHIEVPGIRYNPDIGIFGFDVSVVLGRPGRRVSSRKRARSKVGLSHRITKEEAVAFAQKHLGIEVVE